MYPLKVRVPYDPSNLGSTTHTYTTTYLGNYLPNDVRENVGSHLGVDIIPMIPKDTVMSVLPGEVIKAEFNSYSGNFVIIRHDNVPHPSGQGVTTLFSCYLHLDSLQTIPGAQVDEGDPIGFSGSTGNSTGEHLHFQIDTLDAPYHPYWPFSLAEAKAAGYGFIEATNAGLNIDRARKYSVNPLVYLDAVKTGDFSAFSGINPPKQQVVPTPPKKENPPQKPPIPTNTLFTDVPMNAPYYAALYSLHKKGFISSSENFRPNDSLTRAELLKITLLSAKISLSDSQDKSFSDIPKNSWAYPFFVTAFLRGITKGYSDGSMKPDNPVTRAEALKIIYSTHNYEVPQLSFSVFQDVQLTDWFVSYANYVYSLGIFGQENFLPQTPIRRWEAVIILDDVLKQK